MSKALEYVVSSKTLALWLILAFLAVTMALISLAVLVAWGINNPYLNDVLNFLGVGGGAGTARNVISDGVMPRVPQAVGAAKDPSVAVQPPVSMAHSEGGDSEYKPPDPTH